MVQVVPEPEEKKKGEVVPDPSEPEHAVTGRALYGRMLCTGCFKCILPIAFILLSKPVSDAMQGADETQEAFEQVAGGLLLYTFAYGCWAEISERFEHECGEVGASTLLCICCAVLLVWVKIPISVALRYAM